MASNELEIAGGTERPKDQAFSIQRQIRMNIAAYRANSHLCLISCCDGSTFLVIRRDRAQYFARAIALPRPYGFYFPVFTLVQSRLMMRWVAGSRALITNSFFCIASSG